MESPRYFFYGIQLVKKRWNSTGIFRVCFIGNSTGEAGDILLIENRVKILSVDTKEKESIVNIFFHRYDRRRWKKFHRLSYVHNKDKNATHTEKYARAGR